MTGFLLRRLVYLVCLVVVSTSVAYLLRGHAAQSAVAIRRAQSAAPAEVVDAALDALNMNDKMPVLTRFGRWAGGLLRGDLGRTIDNQAVNDEIGRRMWVSLRLVLIGVGRRHAARRRGRRVRGRQAVPAVRSRARRCSRS